MTVWWVGLNVFLKYSVLYVRCDDDKGKAEDETRCRYKAYFCREAARDARLNAPVLRMHRYQQHNMPSQHMFC